MEPKQAKEIIRLLTAIHANLMGGLVCLGGIWMAIIILWFKK